MKRTFRSAFSFLLRSSFLGLLVAVFILALSPELRTGNGLLSGWFSTPDPRQGRLSYHDALSKAAPAVVNIYSVSTYSAGLYRSQATERTNLGSGVLMTDNGYLLTCYHVVMNADSIYVLLQDSRQLEAQMVGYDRLTDLAVLKVNADSLPVIPQLESPDIRVGDTVMAIGNPFNLGQTITHGIVSRAGRSGLTPYFDYIQTDAVLNRGNSGGALVDSNGYLVGITTANFLTSDGRRGVQSVDGINFALPYDIAYDVMKKIITNGKVIRGQLGFQGEDYPNRPGIVVTRVAPNSAASRAGLQPNDILLAIDGVRLENAAETLDLIAGTAPGTSIELEISRDGTVLTVTAQVEQLQV